MRKGVVSGFNNADGEDLKYVKVIDERPQYSNAKYSSGSIYIRSDMQDEVFTVKYFSVIAILSDFGGLFVSVSGFLSLISIYFTRATYQSHLISKLYTYRRRSSETFKKIDWSSKTMKIKS